MNDSAPKCRWTRYSSSPSASSDPTHRPQDLIATLFQHLSVPQDLSSKDGSGRPVAMIEQGKPIAELF